MASLRIVRGFDLGKVYPLDKDETVIGRLSDCDIVFPQANIARKQIRISCEDNVYYVEHMGSRAGTYVNGEQIMESRRRILLHDGDEIQMCDNLLVFEEEE